MLSLLYKLYFSSKSLICFLVWCFSAVISYLFVYCIHSFTLLSIIITAVMKFLSDNCNFLDLTPVGWIFCSWEWVTFFLFLHMLHNFGFFHGHCEYIVVEIQDPVICHENDGFYLEVLYEMWLKMQILSMSLVDNGSSLSSDYSQSAPSMCESEASQRLE